MGTEVTLAISDITFHDVPAVEKGLKCIVNKLVPYLLVAFLNEVGVLHHSLFELDQAALVELLGVLCAQGLCIVQPDQEGGQDVLLLLLQPPLLLHSQTRLQRQRNG